MSQRWYWKSVVAGNHGNVSDEMEKLYIHLKEASLSPIGDRKPSTKREFRASFIKRCKNHVVNDRLHQIRTLNSTLKVRSRFPFWFSAFLPPISILKNLIWVTPPPSFHSVKGGRSTSDRADPDGSGAHCKQVQRVEGGKPDPGAGDLCEAKPAGGSGGEGGSGGLWRRSCGGDQFMSRGLEDSPHWLWTQTLTATSTSAELLCFNPLDHRVFSPLNGAGTSVIRRSCWYVCLLVLLLLFELYDWIVLQMLNLCTYCFICWDYWGQWTSGSTGTGSERPVFTVRFIFLFLRGEQISACYWCHASNVWWHMYSNCFIVCLSQTERLDGLNVDHNVGSADWIGFLFFTY